MGSKDFQRSKSKCIYKLVINLMILNQMTLQEPLQASSQTFPPFDLSILPFKNSDCSLVASQPLSTYPIVDPNPQALPSDLVNESESEAESELQDVISEKVDQIFKAEAQVFALQVQLSEKDSRISALEKQLEIANQTATRLSNMALRLSREFNE